MPRSRRPAGEGRLLQLVYYGYVAGSALARALPERWVYGLANALGSIAARRSKRRWLVETHLARITGLPRDSNELQDKVVEAFCSYARYWLETFRLVRENREFFLERFGSVGNDNLNAALALGRGAIVVVGHLGNWDAAGAWVGATDRRLVAVAEVLRPRRMFEFFAEHRSRLGMTIYGAEPGITSKLVTEVQNGAVLAIVGDRDLRGNGVEMDFFGEPATFPRGPANIALRSGVPLMVAGVYELFLPDGRRGWMCDISEPLEPPDEGEGAVEVFTQRIAAKLEEYVARHPEQWHVFQPFWLSERKEA